MIPLAIGAVIAVVALGFVLYPVFAGGRARKPEATIDDEIEAAVLAYRQRGPYLHDRCAACGTPVVARDARYCSSCGKQLVN